MLINVYVLELKQKDISYADDDNGRMAPIIVPCGITRFPTKQKWQQKRCCTILIPIFHQTCFKIDLVYEENILFVSILVWLSSQRVYFFIKR